MVHNGPECNADIHAVTEDQLRQMRFPNMPGLCHAACQSKGVPGRLFRYLGCRAGGTGGRFCTAHKEGQVRTGGGRGGDGR